MPKEKFRYRNDLPRAGWFLEDTFDNLSAAFTCENCGYHFVRYVHILQNRKSKKKVSVGCVCAEHLTQDFSTPKLREKVLRSRSGRRMRFPRLNWKRSQKGNLWLKKGGVIFVIKRVRSGAWVATYTMKATEEWVAVPGYHSDPAEAKLAAFDAVYR